MTSSHNRKLQQRRLRSVLAAMERLEVRQFLSDSSGGAASFGPEAVVSRQMEYLDRGVVAINKGAGNVYIGWRLFGNDPANIAFDVYRSSAGGGFVKRNVSPITATTDFVDTGVDTSFTNSYFIRPIIGGVAQPAKDSEIFTLSANSTKPYLSIPLQIPAGGTTPDGVSYSYSANDASVGDVDGDGKYEIILKWDPSNAKDNSQNGYTGNVYIDAYRFDGTLLWRIDMGKNIRAGAHYTQFMVYDLDGDGKAEMAAKTAPGTRDGAGNYVLMGNDDPNADYRNSTGFILSGPEYLTIFNGQTGAAMATTNYIVPRGSVASWGDTQGNRVDRFHGAIAYLDGQRPSLIMARGYYTRATIAAWDWRNGQLTMRWLFDSNDGTPGNTAYRGKGNHNLAIGDVDGDGKDEIMYGAAAINDDGKGMYSGAATGSEHGDAMHFSDLKPDRPGLEVFKGNGDGPSAVGLQLRDALTGETIWAAASTQTGGVGRALALDIRPDYAGYEMWGAGGGISNRLYAADGTLITTLPTGPGVRQLTVNFGLWWDADPLREVLDSNEITKYDWINNRVDLLLKDDSASSNNGTKSNPSLSGDVLGDWREEVIWRASDNTELRVYTTTIPATNRIYTLMHDPIYRLAIAWQNNVYNQPPHPGFFLGDGMSAPPIPNIYLAQASLIPPPAAPSGLGATVAGLNQIALAWTASPSLDVTYRVRRSTVPGGPYTILQSDITGTSYTDTTAANGTTYHYVVSSVDDQPAESLFSNLASAKVPVPQAQQTVYPAENALYGGGAVVSTANSGFNGTGYVDFPGDGNTSGFLQFNNIDGGGGGLTTIRFRYAWGDFTNRQAKMIVNGVSQNLNVPPTYDWNYYAPIEYYVELNQGTSNTIRFEVTGNDFVNIDELLVIANPDSTAPQVTGWSHKVVSSPNVLQFAFTEAVDPSLGLNDLVVTLLGDTPSVITPTSLSYNSVLRIATWTLPPSLADGNYRATFAAGGVIDGSGNALSSTYTYEFHMLGGDANRDRFVDVRDLVILDANWLQSGKTYLEADFNYDGMVNDVDLGYISANWQKALPAPIDSNPPPPAPKRPASRAAVRVIGLVT